MRPTADLVSYLHQTFAPEIWRPASDLIPNRAVSEIATRVDTFPLPGRGQALHGGLPTRRPQALEELTSVLRDVRVRDLLDPRGVTDVPRLFLDVGDPAADAKVDWSRLARGRRTVAGAGLPGPEGPSDVKEG
jgi:hypothetical protein